MYRPSSVEKLLVKMHLPAMDIFERQLKVSVSDLKVSGVIVVILKVIWYKYDASSNRVFLYKLVPPDSQVWLVHQGNYQATMVDIIVIKWLLNW